ncbi:MAG TPA: hypothetical protein PKD26_11610 [Pyrinomonadaceae bacterium]|nr:hypothetical protein [Pyrinomonadaceae bacterium]
MADRKIIHGVLVRVLDRGVLLIGESGIGKSELALELIDRGGKFVADDAVEIRRVGSSLVGSPPELTRGQMFLRGPGLIDVPRTFGDRAFEKESEIDLCIELGHFKDSGDDLVPDTGSYRQLGLDVPIVRLSVSNRLPSAILIEVIVRSINDPDRQKLATNMVESHERILAHKRPDPTGT